MGDEPGLGEGKASYVAAVGFSYSLFLFLISQHRDPNSMKENTPSTPMDEGDAATNVLFEVPYYRVTPAKRMSAELFA